MKIIIAMIALSLTGCASLQYAGNSSYTVEPMMLDGKQVCCAVHIIDGKETASMTAHVVKNGDNYDVTLNKVGETAFKGQQISAAALQTAIDASAKAAVAIALAPLLPAAGAALAAPGIGAAALGGAAIIGVQKITAP